MPWDERRFLSIFNQPLKIQCPEYFPMAEIFRGDTPSDVFRV